MSQVSANILNTEEFQWVTKVPPTDSISRAFLWCCLFIRLLAVKKLVNGVSVVTQGWPRSFYHLGLLVTTLIWKEPAGSHRCLDCDEFNSGLCILSWLSSLMLVSAVPALWRSGLQHHGQWLFPFFGPRLTLFPSVFLCEAVWRKQNIDVKRCNDMDAGHTGCTGSFWCCCHSRQVQRALAILALMLSSSRFDSWFSLLHGKVPCLCLKCFNLYQ